MLRILRIYFILLMASGLIVIRAEAQSSINFSQEYQRAKALYEQGDYQQAIELFQPISRAEKGNPYAPYASYFYAMSALKTGDYNLAKNMFMQIRNKYPRWAQMNEVLYGLVNSYYELENFDQAFELSDQLAQSPQKKDSTEAELMDMKRFYVARASNEVLEGLLAEYPEEKAIAEQLVSNYSVGFFDEEREKKVDSLVQAYSIDLSNLGVASQASSVRKAEYNLAAFLPFFRDKLEESLSDNRVGNQFILDLYRGMKLASEDLQKEGITVRLHAYDTQREYDTTQLLLQRDEMEYMDVFLGPLYQGPFQAVYDYTMNKQKYMFNPLSANPQIIGDNPFSYLVKPSLTTEAKFAARFAIDSLDATQAVVITGPTQRDSARVHTFIDLFKEAYDQEVHTEVIDEYNENAMQNFVDTLQYMYDLGETVVYVASDQELVITNAVSAIVMSGLPLKVIGTDSWLNFTTIAYEQLESMGAHLISPIYLDYSNPEVQDFRVNYRRSYYQEPSLNVFLGYDTVYFIGQMLNEYGIYFQEFFTSENPINSRFFQGYNYYQANDNQVVPIIQFEEGALVVTNVAK